MIHTPSYGSGPQNVQKRSDHGPPKSALRTTAALEMTSSARQAVKQNGLALQYAGEAGPVAVRGQTSWSRWVSDGNGFTIDSPWIQTPC